MNRLRTIAAIVAVALAAAPALAQDAAPAAAAPAQRPTALLGGGKPHPTATQQEPTHLERVWHAVRSAEPQHTHPILDGRHSPHERWNLGFLRPFFEPRV